MNIRTEFESYRLGIDDIDEQHRTLFDYIENLDAAIADGDRWLVVYQTLTEIEHWTKLHFAVEESLMRICRYPHLEQHHSQHAAFSVRVGQMKQQALTRDISRQASKFLHTWLLQHVNADDRKYAEYFLGISEFFVPESCQARPDKQAVHSEIHSARSGNSVNTQQPSILVVGNAETAATVKCLLEGNAGPDVRALTRTGIEEGLALLSSDTGIALVLLLWQGDAPEQLPDLVRSIHARQSNPLLAVMVRSRSRLPEDVGDTLWHLGVADRSFYQPIGSAKLADSVAVAMRNYRRQLTLTEIPALSGIFSDARTLRDLALLSLLVVHEQRLPVRGGLFCYLGGSAERRPILIAGTGCHENHGGIPLEQMEDPLAKSMIQTALDQCRSQFGAAGAAIHLLTPGGYTACIYFALDLPLRPWEIGVLRTISNMIATTIDQSRLALQLSRTQQATINTLSVLAEYRDTDTGEHVARVARMTTEIAQMLSQENQDFDAEFLEQVGLASILHDTGKIAIPDGILLKPGPLDPHERQAMEQHVIFGYDILIEAARRTDDGLLLKMSAEIARYHHERFDGTGYPEGLKGRDIPLAARTFTSIRWTS